MKRLSLFILIICFSTMAWAQDAVQTTSSKTIAATGTTAKKKTMKKVKDAVKSGQVETEAAASTDEANQPPARPGDEEKDPAIWAAYYKAYIAWMKTLGTAERRAAWKDLSRDLLDRVNSHPETISSAAMQAVFRGLTAEFKAMFAADRAYDKKYAAVVNNLVDAGVKFIKTASYKALSQTDSENFIRSFTGLAVETAWQRSNNSWNGHAVAQIAAFYNGLIDSGSAATRPFAFNQLMHLFRTVRWNSQEGNPELGDQLLKQALQGVDPKTLINGFRSRAGNTALAADERGQAACSLSNILYHQSSLETAFGVNMTEAQVVNVTGAVTDVLKGVNSNSIEVSDAMRNSLLHLAGCAIGQSINRGEQTADYNRLFQHAYLKFAQASLQKSGNASLQATAINMLTSIRKASAKKDDEKLAATCKKLLLGDVSDLDGFLDKGQEEMGTTKNADHAAWLARALANIAALNKASKTGEVTDAQIKEMIAAIKDWISVEDNLDNMRLRSWQAELYSALAELAKQIYKKGDALGSDVQLKKDFEQIFSTIVGLQDSKVKALAATYVTSLAADLREQGYGAFANRLEISLCPDSASLMAKAWDYFNKKNYAAARAFCEETISRYTEQALKQQASLKDYAPKGKESLYWALNDVGTAHFILGKIYRAQGQSDQAREEFKTVINKYGFAQCWDKQGWWWKVKDAAKKELSSMNSEPVTMPVIPGTGSTDANGNITITFKSGTLDKNNLSGFWAKVTIDGKTEYWDLGKGAISEDGKSVTLKFGSKYDGKTIAMQFYGFDTAGKQTGFSNAIAVKVETSGTGGFSGFGQPERIEAGGYTELGYTYDEAIYYYDDLSGAVDKKVVLLGGSDSWELTGPDGSKLKLNPWSVIIAQGGKSVADVIQKAGNDYVIIGDVQILNFQNVYHFERQNDYVFRPENQELYYDAYSFFASGTVGLQTLPRELYYHTGTPEPQKVEKVVKPGYDISGLPQNRVAYPSFDLLGGAGVENVRAFGFSTSRGGGGWYVIGPDGMEIKMVSGSRMVFADNPKNALEFVSDKKYRITEPVTVLIMLPDGSYLDKYTITPDSKTYLEYREYYK